MNEIYKNASEEEEKTVFSSSSDDAHQEEFEQFPGIDNKRLTMSHQLLIVLSSFKHYLTGIFQSVESVVVSTFIQCININISHYLLCLKLLQW